MQPGMHDRGAVLAAAFITVLLPGLSDSWPALAAEQVSVAEATRGDQGEPTWAAEGTVERFLLDPRGEVEGLFLAGGIHLYVTSRAADQLIRSFKRGDAVRIYGRLFTEERLVQADVIANLTSGTMFTVPLRLDLPLHEQQALSVTEMSAAGTIRAFLYHPMKNIIHGMLLSDDTQVRFPLDASPQLRSSFRLGDRLMVRGNGTTNQFGRAVEALAIARNGGAFVALDASLQGLP